MLIYYFIHVFRHLLWYIFSHLLKQKYILSNYIMFSLSDWFHEIIQEFTTMASIRRKCLNSPDSFCYICGSFTVPSQRMNISEFVKRAYLAYFKLKVGDQDKSWAPHNVCKPCVENLRQWTKGRRKQLSFGIPMVWREQKSHVDDCYFCLTKLLGIARKLDRN